MRLDKTMLLRSLPGEENQKLREDINDCFNKLNKDLKDMSSRLGRKKDENLRKRIREIFGSDSGDTFTKVKTKIDRMIKVSDRKITLSIKWADSAGDDTYAHVYPDVDPMQAGILFIYLDNRYKIKEENGVDNRYLTLVHEFSHLATGTDDYKYDAEIKWDEFKRNSGINGKCIEPNDRDNYTVDKAIQNADCYGFLMAETYAKLTK